MSDEDIIKRKLLIDGDGTGDDRRLNVIAKSIRRWASAPLPSDEATSGVSTAHDKLLAQLSMCEYSVRRGRLLAATVHKQMDQYRACQQKLAGDIDVARDAICQGRLNLQQAKVFKQNRLLYDLMAQRIGRQPARQTTDSRLQQLRDELQQLRRERDSLEERLEQRRRQFHVLVTSATRLQDLLADDDDDNTEEEVQQHVLNDNSAVVMAIAAAKSGCTSGDESISSIQTVDDTGPEPMSE